MIVGRRQRVKRVRRIRRPSFDSLLPSMKRLDRSMSMHLSMGSAFTTKNYIVKSILTGKIRKLIPVDSVEPTDAIACSDILCDVGRAWYCH